MSAPEKFAEDSQPLSDVQILAGVYITERPEALKLDCRGDQIRALVVAGILEGKKPILMYWLDGKQALLMIDASQDMPPLDLAILAYRQCESCKSDTSKGILTWHE